MDGRSGLPALKDVLRRSLQPAGQGQALREVGQSGLRRPHRDLAELVRRNALVAVRLCKRQQVSTGQWGMGVMAETETCVGAVRLRTCRCGRACTCDAETARERRAIRACSMPKEPAARALLWLGTRGAALS